MSAIEAARAAGLLEAGSPALIIVDVQHDFADPATLAGWGVAPEAIADVDAAVESCAVLVRAARASGVPIIWVGLATDDDHPWRSSTWLRTGSLVGDDEQVCVAGTTGADWWKLEPADGEIRVAKRHYSGFVGTDLASILNDLQVGWVAIAGLTTECCILATAFDAAQHDLPVVVVTDGTAAYTRELHEAALGILALNVADLRPTEQLVSIWNDREATR